MNVALANPYDPPFKRFFVYSLVLHASLAVLVLVSIFVQMRGSAWGSVGGGGEGSVRVGLVRSLPGIPLPNPPVATERRVVDPTKGLHKEEPKPKKPEPPTDATKLPKFEKNKPLPPSHPSRVFENKTPPPDNAVPYGQTGAPQLPSGSGVAPSGPPGGVAMQGPGGGDFASRYSWYVEAVRRRISGNWLQSTIDTRVLQARTAHCVVMFTILRDGTVKDVHVTQSSGNSSMDTSGVRAVLSSSPMPPLPSDYSGSYVVVTFDFDLGMTR